MGGRPSRTRVQSPKKKGRCRPPSFESRAKAVHRYLYGIELKKGPDYVSPIRKRVRAYEGPRCKKCGQKRYREGLCKQCYWKEQARGE